MLKLSIMDKRTTILWIVTGFIVGSINALLLDQIRQNALYLIYDGLVGGWLFLLTAIASTYIKERKNF